MIGVCFLLTFAVEWSKMRAIVLLALCAVAASAAPDESNSRIVGGSLTTINNYPTIAVLLYAANSVNFVHDCGGVILNQRAILSAAHCFQREKNVAGRWRIRLGSSFASSGGTLYTVSTIRNHQNFHQFTQDSDISVLRTASTINYINNAVQRASLGSYQIGDNQVVWAAGWGVTETGRPSEQLRHVQIWTINQSICNQRYGGAITANMLCSGVLDVGGRDQCTGDSGGPLYHSGIVVGVASFGNACAHARYPGVNTRISRFISWIEANAN